MASANYTLTDNGAPALVSTQDALLDLFHALHDSTPSERIDSLLSPAWKSSPTQALKIIFYVLDVREGKACNRTARMALKWLAEHQPETFLKNLKHVPFFGYYKDLPELLLSLLMEEKDIEQMLKLKEDNQEMYGKIRTVDTRGVRRPAIDKKRKRKLQEASRKHVRKLEKRSKSALQEHPTDIYAVTFAEITQIFADAIKDEMLREPQTGKSSLAAKWVPSEGSGMDRILHIYPAVAKAVTGMRKSRYACAKFRKQFISPLRLRSVVIPEVHMSSGDWSIPYECVPGRSMSRNAAAFKKHDHKGFMAFVESALKANGAGLHAGTLKPHELVEECIRAYSRRNAYNFDFHDDDSLAKFDDNDPAFLSDDMKLVEGQWRALVELTRSKGTLKSTLAVVDVSGSMIGEPMTVAIALGILTSTVCSGVWHNKMVTFSERPSFFTILDGTLVSQVKDVQSMPFGFNTDFVAVFDLMLKHAKRNKVPPANMVEQIITISDMQFDRAGGDRFKTSYQRIKQKYQKAGYAIPRMVFWDVANVDRNNVPLAHDEQGTILLSGFSANLLKLILDGEDLSPETTPMTEELLADDPTLETTPRDVMLKAIEDCRYDRLSL